MQIKTPVLPRNLPARTTVEFLPPTETALQPARPSVLVIDPDAGFLALIARALTPQFTVMTACDAQQAIALARATPIDLILLDLTMPQADSVSLLQILCDHPRLRATPLLALATSPELRKQTGRSDVIAIAPKARWVENLRACVQLTLEAACGSPPAPEAPRTSISSPTLNRKKWKARAVQAVSE